MAETGKDHAAPRPAPASGYVSIFWNPDGLHERHRGWTVVQDTGDMKVFAQARGPFRRFLAMARGDAARTAAADPALLALAGPMTELQVHDFASAAADHPLTVSGLRPIRISEKMLPTATLAMDLRQSAEAVFARMTADYRRKIRRAEETARSFRAHAAPDGALLARFVAAHGELGKRNGFRGADPAQLRSMYAAGEGILYEMQRDGETANLLHVYVANSKALFLYGVNLGKENDGGGQYFHWRIMNHLRGLGVEWYDLGGVHTTRDDDGVYVFKSRFGGDFIDQGGEYIRRGRLFQIGKTAIAALGRVKRLVTALLLALGTAPDLVVCFAL